MDLDKKLLQLKERIESCKTQKAMSEGKLESYMEKLKKDFGFSSLKEADEALAEMQAEIEEKEELLKEKLATLEMKYARA